MIELYHTDNGIFNDFKFVEELLKKQQKIRFSGSGASHQNGAAERAIKTIVTMERIMLMLAELRCPDDTFPLIFGQWKCIMLYGSTIGYLICSMYNPLFKYGQGQGLSQCQKPLATVMFGVFQNII